MCKDSCKKEHSINIKVDNDLYWKIKSASALKCKAPAEWLKCLATDYISKQKGKYNV